MMIAIFADFYVSFSYVDKKDTVYAINKNIIWIASYLGYTLIGARPVRFREPSSQHIEYAHIDPINDLRFHFGNS